MNSVRDDALGVFQREPSGGECGFHGMGGSSVDMAIATLIMMEERMRPTKEELSITQRNALRVPRL